MDRETELRLLREAFAALVRGAPPMAEAPSRNDPRAYTSPARAAAERERLCRRRPHVAAFSSELRAPGGWVGHALGPVPVLVVRQSSGEIRAFANACRHRGARLAEGCGRASRGFTCPYHAWSYELDGTLADVPDEFGFPGLDRASRGLVELPAAERHGLVWVLATPGEAIDLDAGLGDLGADLAGFGLERYALVETRLLRRRMNWKLASDTFWEAYHLKVLHRRTIAKLFVRNLGLFEPFGPSHRYVGVRASIEELRGRPESEWSLLPHATILMSLFPNTVLVLQSDHFEAVRIYPGETPGECTMRIDVLAPPETAEHREHWRQITELLLGVVDEDFTLGEGIQRSFESGAVPEILYGRFEQALEHFHRSVREAVGEG